MQSSIFDEMAKARAEAEMSGIDVIDLGIGSPDQEPPEHVVEQLKKQLDIRTNYDYPGSSGLPELRTAIAGWYLKRFGVELDPLSETLVLMGSHEGLGHIFMALLNEGDIALIPDPHYPIYKVGTLLAGADTVMMPLTAANGFLPDLDAIPAEAAHAARVMVLNYPNNPVTAVADRPFFERVIAFAKEHEILVVHDAAYSELGFGEMKPPSILEVRGAKDHAVEFHSVSKSFNIAGFRLGFMVGNPDVISIVARLKSNMDYGVFRAIQYAGIAALTGPQEIIERNKQEYVRRMESFVSETAQGGWVIPRSPATMFLWAPVPARMSSRDFALALLRGSGVCVTPGSAFGEMGEGYVRIALVKSYDTIVEAARRISRFLQTLG